MGDVVANPLQFNKSLDQFYDRFEKKFRARMKLLMTEGMVRLLRRTPVNTGQAAMNYIASVGAPASGYRQGYTPVEATNKLPLGVEALRGPAEAISKATLASVKYDDPFQVYWIVNNTPHIGGLEAGELPEEPYTPRSPQGMFGVTLVELANIMESVPL